MTAQVASARHSSSRPPSSKQHPPGTCWSSAQAQASCGSIACVNGTSVHAAALKTACSSPLAPGNWTFSPAPPVWCPRPGKTKVVNATLAVASPAAGGGACSYYTTVSLITPPGERAQTRPRRRPPAARRPDVRCCEPLRSLCPRPHRAPAPALQCPCALPAAARAWIPHNIPSPRRTRRPLAGATTGAVVVRRTHPGWECPLETTLAATRPGHGRVYVLRAPALRVR